MSAAVAEERELREERRVVNGLASVARAQSNASLKNDLAVIEGFAERGIRAEPRVDVFTFNGWLALGRRVRKGEHGVRLGVKVATSKAVLDEVTGQERRVESSFLKGVTVFHISQTEVAK